jgi:hypothetical protein
MAQEARLVGIELSQPKPQPFQAPPQLAHVGRAAHVDRLVEAVLTQPDDRRFQSLERACQPDAEGERESHRDRNGGHDLSCQLGAA